jgi:hypothetical protein
MVTEEEEDPAVGITAAAAVETLNPNPKES